MASGELQGWVQDPFGVHEKRYFSAGRPTRLVRDGDVDGYDEPPSSSFEMPAAMAGEEAPVPGDAATSGDPGAGLRRSFRGRLLLAAVAAIAVGAVTAVLAVGVGSKSTSTTGTPRISPAAFVAESARHTLSEHTAQISLTGTFPVAGGTATAIGTGEIDFGAGAMADNLSYRAPGRSVLRKEIIVAGSLYLSMIINGQGFTRDIGREWMQMPAPQADTPNPFGSNAFALMGMLERFGMDVRALGTKAIAGRSCSGYSLSLSPSKQAAARASASALATPYVTPPTITVWFDAQRLLCQVGATFQVSSPASGTIVTADTYSNWGKPVHITAPPPSGTVPADADSVQRYSYDGGIICGWQGC